MIERALVCRREHFIWKVIKLFNTLYKNLRIKDSGVLNHKYREISLSLNVCLLRDRKQAGSSEKANAAIAIVFHVGISRLQVL